MASENTKVNTNTPVSPVELLGLAAKTQQLALGQISSLIKDGPVDTHDPLDLARPYTALLGHWSRQPLQAAEVIGKYWQKNTLLNWNIFQQMYGMDTEPTIEPGEDERRFLDEAWTGIPWFNYIKQSYLLYADFVSECFNSESGLSESDAEKLHFFSQQWLNAIAPSNFAMTNPVVVRKP